MSRGPVDLSNLPNSTLGAAIVADVTSISKLESLDIVQDPFAHSRVFMRTSPYGEYTRS